MRKSCPCHSGRPYPQCCQPYHKGKLPETAVALMRSRYAAYALGKISYVMQTQTPPQSDKAAWRKSLKQFSQQTNFVGLAVLAAAELSPTRATVTFVAMLIQEGQDASFEECSLFEQVNGRWRYIKAVTK